ncbi:hypothetical protein [Micromonospora sp. NPDC023644]|uniref:hypothetical protein n=1 Tax=Micromonospora sp. NPDC023644 TaxID=3154321 RepID=UPI0033CB5E14
MTDIAQVYINWGRMVVECPHDGCLDAREVQPGQASEVCAAGHPLTVQWPDDIAQILAVLGERPQERTRNWFPQGHSAALRSGQPHGQTVTELREEARAQEEASVDRAEQARALLAGLGLEFDPVTGIVKGL